jgi:hypothetical protein
MEGRKEGDDAQRKEERGTMKETKEEKKEGDEGTKGRKAGRNEGRKEGPACLASLDRESLSKILGCSASVRKKGGWIYHTGAVRCCPLYIYIYIYI